MIRTTGIRIAALLTGAAAAVAFAGCGNGVEVRGPSAPSSSAVTSPAPDSSPSKAPTNSDASDDAASTKAATSHPSPTGQRTHDGSDDGSDNGSDNGSDSGSNNGSDDGSGDGSGDGNGESGGSKSSAPSNDDGQQQSGGNATIKCTLGDLDISVRVPAGGGAAGSQYVLLRFTNSSPEPCTMYGYAGVSFVGHQNGTQLGKPAVRDRSRPLGTVKLASGASKSELLRIAEAGNFDPKQCQPTTSDGFRVYPPDSYVAAYVPFKTSACQGKIAQLTVYPVGTKG